MKWSDKASRRLMTVLQVAGIFSVASIGYSFGLSNIAIGGLGLASVMPVSYISKKVAGMISGNDVMLYDVPEIAKYKDDKSMIIVDTPDSSRIEHRFKIIEYERVRGVDLEPYGVVFFAKDDKNKFYGLDVSTGRIFSRESLDGRYYALSTDARVEAYTEEKGTRVKLASFTINRIENGREKFLDMFKKMGNGESIVDVCQKINDEKKKKQDAFIAEHEVKGLENVQNEFTIPVKYDRFLDVDYCNGRDIGSGTVRLKKPINEDLPGLVKYRHDNKNIYLKFSKKIYFYNDDEYCEQMRKDTKEMLDKWMDAAQKILDRNNENMKVHVNKTELEKPLENIKTR